MINKKNFILSIMIIIALSVVADTFVSPNKSPEINARSYILIEADSRKIISQKNANIPYAAASMTKLMTEYIVLKHIEEGKLTWNEKIDINENTSNSKGVKINVKVGDSLSVKDLFHSMVIASSNNAAVALAEKISGSEEKFTVLMNKQAKKLGLSNQTYFVNATGLENDQLIESNMTAHDVAILAVRLIEDFPQILETTKLPFYSLDFDGTHLNNTNAMLSKQNLDLWYEGVDGLKTGYTNKAGYCFAGTAFKGNKRLVSVVMGTSDWDNRFIETKKLYTYGFRQSFFGGKHNLLQALNN